MHTVHDPTNPPRSHRELSPHSVSRSSVAIIARLIFVRVILLPGAVLVPQSANAGLIYTMENYPTLQNGYTVSGTISTTGATGTSLPLSDITDWDIMISTTSGPLFQLTPTNSAIDGDTFGATPTQITVSATGSNLLEFQNSSVGNAIAWNDGFPYTAYAAFNNGSALFDLTSLPSPFVIATITTTGVPEPSSLLLAAFGSAATIVYSRSRQRRKELRQAAAQHAQPSQQPYDEKRGTLRQSAPNARRPLLAHRSQRWNSSKIGSGCPSSPELPPTEFSNTCRKSARWANIFCGR
jgi:hypothetical protein